MYVWGRCPSTSRKTVAAKCSLIFILLVGVKLWSFGSPGVKLLPGEYSGVKGKVIALAKPVRCKIVSCAL